MTVDDPEDADFEPDHGDTSGRTLKKVCHNCTTMLFHSKDIKLKGEC